MTTSLTDTYLTAQKNLVNFRGVFLPTNEDLPSAGFHYQWSHDLIHGDKHICYEGFRESAKTSYVMRVAPLYHLVYPNDEWRFIVIIKANQRHARRTLKTITSEYMSNEMLRVNLKKVYRNTADAFEADIYNPATKKVQRVLIEAYGKGASLRGLNNRDTRPTIILIDDPQDKSDMRSEHTPELDWEWFLSDVLFLGKNARIFMIGNNLGERCIVERVEDAQEELGFEFRRIPIANEDLSEAAWPEFMNSRQIKDEREAFAKVGELDVWLMERMCQSVNELTRLFKEDMFQYYTPKLADRLADEGEVYAVLDPASSRREDSCLRAIVVGALMKDGHWYILDAPYGRWDSVELMDEMFRIVNLWGVRTFGIEKGHYQQVIEPVLYREMTQRNCRFNIEELEHGKIGSKLERIKMMQPYFKSKSVWFPDDAWWLSEMKSELAGVTRDEIKSRFSDVMDALAMLLEQMKQYSSLPRRREVRVGNLQRRAL